MEGQPMREKTYHLYLNEEERSQVIQSLIALKNNLAAQGRYTDAARETFELNEGDRLVVLGDDAEGIALVKADVFEQRVQEAIKLSRQMTNE